MKNEESFEVMIVGGSYAGLSAAMALGRSLRRVLIIDGGNPCNAQTPHSHNMITLDGVPPAEITAKAKAQVLNYETVEWKEGIAVTGRTEGEGFTVGLASGETFHARKLLFAAGLKDLMPAIEGFAECWGISVLHCPYCHGYEVANKPIGVLGNGDGGFELARLISNWSKNLTLYTNGLSTLGAEQTEKLRHHNIEIVEKEIDSLEHGDGYLERVLFKDGTGKDVSAVFARIGFEQHCRIPEDLGCRLTEHGHIEVDELQRTTVSGIYAAGDCTTGFRAVSGAVASGGKAGAAINKELIDEEF